MRRLPFPLQGFLLLTFVFWNATAGGQEEKNRLTLPDVEPTSPFLQRQLPAYRNFAFTNFTNYPDHSSPYADQPRSFYSSLGSYLITGYEVYDWRETRTPGQQHGSVMFKHMNTFRPVFDQVMVARDGYGDWGYSTILGDGVMAYFTPLTLAKVNLNGLRIDFSKPNLKITTVASRLERQATTATKIGAAWIVDGNFFADSNTMLLGSRAETQIGALRLGLNGVNMHLYQSTQPGNGLKGRVRPDNPVFDLILLRVADDSPTDGRGGPVVQEMKLVVNGQVRPEIRPQVLRHRAGISTSVGTISRATGEFRPVLYNRPTAVSGFAGSVFYRDREMPLFADYIYRFNHESGEDVSGDTDLEGLLATFVVESPEAILRAEEGEVLIYLFDVSEEPTVESVAVEALMGNDYRVDVATLWEVNTRARNVQTQYKTTYYRTTLRAKGNTQDLSNLNRVRFKIGEDTALFVYGADAAFSLAGFQINGEYARSSLYARYPAHVQGERRFDDAPRFATRDAAYNLRILRWFGRGRVGAEYFSMNPDYTTEIRSYLLRQDAYDYGDLAGLTNQTVYWRLVQDNDDRDRFVDAPLGHNIAAGRDQEHVDPNGTFPGHDEDNDGIPDTNRNFNGLPDYEEPFLMYSVEPNKYVYGLDRNNNDEVDQREDDLDVDLPYDLDQRGVHVFGQLDLTRHWSLGVGRHDVEEVAGSGRNKSTYALVNYQREGVARLRRIFFENHLRRVKDDIPDRFNELVERPRVAGVGAGDGALEISSIGFYNQSREDPLFYRDSYVNETYFEGALNIWSTLRLAHKLRLRLNWQQGGSLPGGNKQRERRLDLWTVVSRADYTWHWGRLNVQPQFKFMLFRLVDQDADRQPDGTYASRALTSEFSTIPILRLECPLMSRTLLQVGFQGLGPLPYRFKDKVRERQSFERRTAFVNLINRSSYFGYDLYTIVGFTKDSKEFDDVFQRSDTALGGIQSDKYGLLPIQVARLTGEFNAWSVFVRALVGFTEFGRAL